MSPRHLAGRAGALALVASLAGCDIDQSFLFPTPIEGVPGIQDLGTLTPIELTTPDQVAKKVIYGELGPTGSAEQGGLTFEFEGIGGSVCVFIDPETVFWNQSVSPTSPVGAYSEIDNYFDDGDLDLYGGLSVYYNGTPGEKIGDFQVRYEDSLGNNTPIDLVRCIQQDLNGTSRGHAGRGTAEYCEISVTLPGVSYTVMLQSFSTPLDDDRLGYGLLITKGKCAGSSGFGEGLVEFMGGSSDDGSVFTLECIIRGESIQPGNTQGAKALEAGLPEGLPTWLGDEVPTWPDAKQFEQAFCDGEVNKYCRQERKDILEAGLTCAWEADPSEADAGARCFCGDPADAPSGGAF